VGNLGTDFELFTKYKYILRPLAREILYIIQNILIYLELDKAN
jgi:hypothetical protein